MVAMNALILGGSSPRHKDWVRNLAEALQPHFDQVRSVEYRHWELGGESDVAYELEQAVHNVSGWEQEYIIVAKSMGTIITMLGVANGGLAPKRCVLLGVPLGILRAEWHAAEDLLPLTEHLQRPEDALATLPGSAIVQNEHDPHGSAKDVRALVSASGNDRITVRSTPGDTHDYMDFAMISRFALSLE